jgi:hypothetical protein
MGAALIRATREIIALFQETSAVNQAHCAKDKIEASGRRANREECL